MLGVGKVRTALRTHEERGETQVAFDIEFVERTITASMEAKAQRAPGGDKAAQLAEALEEYNRCLAELVDYLNVSSRHPRAD